MLVNNTCLHKTTHATGETPLLRHTDVIQINPYLRAPTCRGEIKHASHNPRAPVQGVIPGQAK